MVFDENSSWDWNESLEAVDTIALEWGNKDKGNFDYRVESESNDQHGDQYVDQEVSIINVVFSNNNDNTSSRPERDHRRPLYMRDYVSGEECYEEEAYMVMFAAATDRVFFEEAVKDAKWRMSINAEIDAIE